MGRELLPIDILPVWSKLNNVDLNGVEVSPLKHMKGSGVIATRELSEEDAILMTVPRELLLSHENVWMYAKADRHLQDLLEAVGEYSRTARGAILLFLLMQIKSQATHLGTANPWTEYVKFLPEHVPLPTFWNEEERGLLEGTSLAAALDAKLGSLDREYRHIRESIHAIKWCQPWFDEEDPEFLIFEEWKQIDAIYRSRALDLPGTGYAMVPCIDMANHASGEETSALYETDADSNGILVLRDGKQLNSGDEVTITYGDEKGACEMLFSYGFLEERTTTAKVIFLDIDIPDDDPLKLAKKSAFNVPYGFSLYLYDGSITWEGPFVWLLCINEEDGLTFKVLQNNDGEKRLSVAWKDTEIEDISGLEKTIRADISFDVFHVRAVSSLQIRIEEQLVSLERSKESIESILKSGDADARICDSAIQLRDLELTLLLHAYEEMDQQKIKLLKSTVVQEYLHSSSLQQEQKDFN